MIKTTWNRRELMLAGAAMGMSSLSDSAERASMMRRLIPGSDEQLPVIGLGTYKVFDVAGSDEEISARRAIVDMLADAGGSVVDTSPMYNRSEKIIGDIIASGSARKKLFLATKVWTNGRDAGIAQMGRSSELMKTDVIDLMQVHNLRDTDVHMATIRNWQEQGRIRYSGLTHYTAGAHSALEAAMKKFKPQFIQINYSLGERGAEDRVLPLARDMGIAALINRPFLTGRLFRAVSGYDVPDWAQSFANSWGQFFLKFIISHPAVSCVIPATSKLHHMRDNLGAGFGPLPGSATRKRMAEYMGNL